MWKSDKLLSKKGLRYRIFQVIEVAAPGDRGSKIYDSCMLTLIILSVIPLCFKTTNPVFLWIDRCTVSIFILDYAVRWWTADYKCNSDSWTAYLRYPFTFFAILDLLSILPSLSILSEGFKLLRLFRLFKALRALRLLRYSKSFILILDSIQREKRALGAVSILAAGYILLSALIMFQVEPDSFGDFFDAVYWAVVTLTTVGYGDLYPVTGIGRAVSMLSSFAGIAIVALPTGIITAGYMDELYHRTDRQKQEGPDTASVAAVARNFSESAVRPPEPEPKKAQQKVNKPPVKQDDKAPAEEEEKTGAGRA